MRCEIRLVSDERVLTLKHCVKVNISGGGWSSCVIHTRRNTGSTCMHAALLAGISATSQITILRCRSLCRSDTGQQVLKLFVVTTNNLAGNQSFYWFMYSYLGRRSEGRKLGRKHVLRGTCTLHLAAKGFEGNSKSSKSIGKGFPT